LYGKLKPLFDEAYNLYYPAQMIPKTGRYFFPVFSQFTSEFCRDWSRGRILLTIQDLENREKIKEAFQKADRYKKWSGTAFCAKFNNKFFACNPWENWDKDSWFSFNLEAPFSSLYAELPVNCWVIGKQDRQKLMLLLNGREGKEITLKVSTKEKLEVFVEPKGSLVAQNYDGETYTFVISGFPKSCELILKIRR